MNAFYRSHNQRQRGYHRSYATEDSHGEICNNIIDTVNRSYALQQEHNNNLYRSELERMEKEISGLRLQNATMRQSQKSRMRALQGGQLTSLARDNQNYQQQPHCREDQDYRPVRKVRQTEERHQLGYADEPNDEGGTDEEEDEEDEEKLGDSDAEGEEPDCRTYTFKKTEKGRSWLPSSSSRRERDAINKRQRDLSKEFAKVQRKSKERNEKQRQKRRAATANNNNTSSASSNKKKR